MQDTLNIITAQGVRVSEFNGSKSLSLLAGSLLRVQPDLPDAHHLRGWYDRAGATASVTNISARYVAPAFISFYTKFIHICPLTLVVFSRPWL